MHFNPNGIPWFIMSYFFALGMNLFVINKQFTTPLYLRAVASGDKDYLARTRQNMKFIFVAGFIPGLNVAVVAVTSLILLLIGIVWALVVGFKALYRMYKEIFRND